MPILTWETFEGKIASLDTVTHQHISNCYWFLVILWRFQGNITKQLILSEIINRFAGVILPYRPKIEFKQEVIALLNKGHIKFINDYLFEIWHEDDLVGKIESNENLFNYYNINK